MKQAMFWERKGESVVCRLCPRNCVIPEGRTGFCRVRKNEAGRLVSLVYGKAVALHQDPIEKKPLFHFAPGSECLSVATVGCNLDCDFCQNWDISHPEAITGEDISPEEVVESAVEKGLPGIAYTYTEPTIFFEYAYDIMKIAKGRGLYNVWVSNGYTSPEAVRKAGKYLDAINVDLKGDREFYRKICKVPDSSPVFEALREYKKVGVHIEVTTLLIPGYNDSEKDVRELCEWVKENLGRETPMHFSRFRPEFRMMHVPSTPVESLERALETARQCGMEWVYIGNVPGHENENTVCPDCGEVLIKRDGYSVRIMAEKCRCGKTVPIKGRKWSPLLKE